MTRFAPPVWAAERAWSATTMTPISKLLKQSPALFESAVEQTQDVNEAYFLIHGVMAFALNRARAGDLDLAPVLACALRTRSQRMAAAL